MMNKSNLHAIRKQLSRPHFPTAPGISSLGPGNALRSAANPQQFFCVRIYLLPDDPNDNGGLDSNGYYVGYLEDATFDWSLATNGPEVRVVPDTTASGIGDTGAPPTPLLATGQRVWAYSFFTTTGSDDSDDDGYTMLRPIGAFVVPRDIFGALSGSVSASGSIAQTVSGITDTENGSTPTGSGSPATITIHERSGILSGVSGNGFLARENVVSQTWYFIWIQCPSS